MMRNILMLASVIAVSADKATYLAVLKATCEPTFINKDVSDGPVPTCGSATFDYHAETRAPICRTPQGSDWCYIPCRTVPDKDRECPVDSIENNAESVGAASSSRASSSMRDTLLFNGMRGWKDVRNAQFLGFPSTLEWRRGLVPSVRSKAGFTMELDCVVGGAGNMCDHFVFVYSCPPCEFADGGDLVSLLLADGFLPHRCQTVFDLDKTQDSALHNVVIYHKQTPAGQNDLIKAPELMEFTWYGSSRATSYCPAYETEEECNNSDPKECVWRDNTCEHHFCPKPKQQQGPWPSIKKCQVCPFDPTEAPFIPELRV